MCHMNSPPTINMQENSAKPARKSRTKLRKPKFLSLRLELSTQSPETAAEEMGRGDRHRRKSRRRNQLSFLPGRQESSSMDVEMIRDDENVAADFLFNGDDTSATTLSGLLDGEGAAQPADMVSSPVDSVGSRADSVSTQLRDAIEYRDRRSSLLVRTAMKSGGRRGTDHGEEMVEKWVSYSEVVERKIHEDEVSSCTAANHGLEGRRRRRVGEKEAGQLLCLKLDYEQVLSSWSDKGSLFIHGGGVDHHYHEPPPQTVPELGCELLTRDSAIGGQMDGSASAVNVWAVPDVPNGDINLEEKDQAWLKQREASVMRYKEKRQNRLFAKRIRYEVRKLNAESRPRVKGRFVRRD